MILFSINPARIAGVTPPSAMPIVVVLEIEELSLEITFVPEKRSIQTRKRPFSHPIDFKTQNNPYLSTPKYAYSEKNGS